MPLDLDLDLLTSYLDSHYEHYAQILGVKTQVDELKLSPSSVLLIYYFKTLMSALLLL